MVSKSELFASLRAVGHDPSDDQISRFRAAGIVEEFVPIPGRGAERYATPDTVERLLIIYATIKRLRLQKPRPSELAFWLAHEGHYVPPDLVAAHFEASIKAQTSALYRQLGRRVSLPIRSLNFAGAGRVADSVYKFFETITELDRETVSGAFLRVVTRSLIGVLFRSESYAAIAPYFRRPLVALIGSEKADLHARELWETLAEFAPLLTDSERNPILLAIERDRSTNPVALLTACKDGRLMTKLLAEVLPWITDVELLREPPYKIDDTSIIMVSRYFEPFAAATFLLLHDNEYTQHMLAKLRVGDYSETRARFAELAKMWIYLKTAMGV